MMPYAATSAFVTGGQTQQQHNHQQQCGHYGKPSLPGGQSQQCGYYGKPSLSGGQSQQQQNHSQQQCGYYGKPSFSGGQSQQQQRGYYGKPSLSTSVSATTTRTVSPISGSSVNNHYSRKPAFGQVLNRPSSSAPPSQQHHQQHGMSESVPSGYIQQNGNTAIGSGKPVDCSTQYQYQQQQQHMVAASALPAATAHAGSHTSGSVSTVVTTGLMTQAGNPTQCHKVDYEIKGSDCQLVEVQLDPEETVVAEAGAMMYLDDGVDFKAKFGDGSNPSQGLFSKLLSAGGRLMTGESLFLTQFTNKAQKPARVAFAAPYPGTILALDLQQLGGKLICQKDAFLCAALGTKISVHLHKKIGSGLFGGEGFILQKLKGDGMAFVHAGGTVVARELRAGERIRLDTGCLVAFTEGISYDVTFVPGLKSMVFGGEGVFLATLSGTGTVWMQSLPFSRMCDRVLANARTQGGNVGEGTPLTGKIGNFIDGDGIAGGLHALAF